MFIKNRKVLYCVGFHVQEAGFCGKAGDCFMIDGIAQSGNSRMSKKDLLNRIFSVSLI
jgi:hypothetical protein